MCEREGVFPIPLFHVNLSSNFVHVKTIEKIGAMRMFTMQKGGSPIPTFLFQLNTKNCDFLGRPEIFHVALSTKQTIFFLHTGCFQMAPTFSCFLLNDSVPKEDVSHLYINNIHSGQGLHLFLRCSYPPFKSNVSVGRRIQLPHLIIQNMSSKNRKSPENRGRI